MRQSLSQESRFYNFHSKSRWLRTEIFSVEDSGVRRAEVCALLLELHIHRRSRIQVLHLDAALLCGMSKHRCRHHGVGGVWLHAAHGHVGGRCPSVRNRLIRHHGLRHAWHHHRVLIAHGRCGDGESIWRVGRVGYFLYGRTQCEHGPLCLERCAIRTTEKYAWQYQHTLVACTAASSSSSSSSKGLVPSFEKIVPLYQRYPMKQSTQKWYPK
jgi:hypothetical protein